MAGTLAIVYSALVLLVAIGGLAFVFALPDGREGESAWSRWGNFTAIAVFLVALVLTLLVTS